MYNKIINSFSGKYFFLSNFYNSKIFFNGLLYNNNESAFQSMKCKNFCEIPKFTNLSPNEAKKLGRHVKLREDWEEIKNYTMYRICNAKFSQNPELKLKLLQTENSLLIEGNNWGDKYWGQVDGIGENNLGKILMNLRDNYKSNCKCLCDDSLESYYGWDMDKCIHCSDYKISKYCIYYKNDLNYEKYTR